MVLGEQEIEALDDRQSGACSQEPWSQPHGACGRAAGVAASVANAVADAIQPQKLRNQFNCNPLQSNGYALR
jgi:hypothetical protein